MKVYTEPCKCSICDGDGVSAFGACTWGNIRHVDPAICASNLRRKREELDRREAALKEAGG